MLSFEDKRDADQHELAAAYNTPPKRDVKVRSTPLRQIVYPSGRQATRRFDFGLQASKHSSV